MNKNELNTALREYSQQKLSPTLVERDLVKKIYAALQVVLGSNNCLQIGSYPRYTAITPLHDLDVLYRVGAWPGSIPNPQSILQILRERIGKEFENPTDLRISVEVQTHSITISFLEAEDVNFAVDIVPAYVAGVNEFQQETYIVPEVVTKRPSARRSFYDELARTGHSMNWIKSDPRGYIEVAKRINDVNEDFRKSAKTAKAWKWFCKEQDKDFKLKSFHIEQVITMDFRANPALEIYDALTRFFQNLPGTISRPQILDRADSDRYIDAYVAELSPQQKQNILAAGNLALQKLVQMTTTTNVEDVLNDAIKHELRASAGSQAQTTHDDSFVPPSPWGII